MTGVGDAWVVEVAVFHLRIGLVEYLDVVNDLDALKVNADGE